LYICRPYVRSLIGETDAAAAPKRGTFFTAPSEARDYEFRKRNSVAVVADGLVPNLPMRSGSCGTASEPSASGDSNSADSTGSVCNFADFCYVARHLIIELDGGQNAEREAQRKDVLRTAYLSEQGVIK
jgi:hypothetical protein